MRDGCLAKSAKNANLLNVQLSFSRRISKFINRKNREDWHCDCAEKALAAVRGLVAHHGVPHATSYTIGDRA